MSRTVATPRHAPHDRFASPDEILARLDLTAEEKDALLQEWEFHDRRLLESEDEGMVHPPADEEPDGRRPRLREVRGARHRLAAGWAALGRRRDAIRASAPLLLPLFIAAVLAGVVFGGWAWAIGAVVVAGALGLLLLADRTRRSRARTRGRNDPTQAAP